MRGLIFLTDFVIDAEPVFHLRAEILDDDVGLLRQLEEDRLAFLGLQIEGQAALVAMQVLEIEPVAPRAGDIAPRLARRLDLDDIGAPIGELADRGRPGAGMTQIENGKTGERQRSDAHDEVPCLKSVDATATFAFPSPPRQDWPNRLGASRISVTRARSPRLSKIRPCERIAVSPRPALRIYPARNRGGGLLLD